MSRRPGAQIVFCALNILIPLLSGLLIYLFFRKDAYILVLIGNRIQLPELPESACPGWLTALFRNSVSDMLWAYALTFAVRSAVGYSRKKGNVIFVICVGFEILTEAAQNTGLVHGTFDVLDMILEAFSICIALLIMKKFEEAYDEKNNANPFSVPCSDRF